MKQQFDQELDHFAQSLQALNIAKNKFIDCINSIESVEKSEENQDILVPASGSLYLPGKMVKEASFMVDVGTGYFVEKNASEAITFYRRKVDKLSQESLQIQNIIKEKAQASMSIENRIRDVAFQRHEELKKQETA